MNEVQGKIENEVLFIYLTGHVDSTNSSEIEAKIDVLYNENIEKSIIIDAENLKYISSAGLRVLLRLQKKTNDLKIINVSVEVYEVFNMTGFTEIINIEKAYRHLSVDGCEVIGQGANGKVYRLDPDTIIKVYRHLDCLDEIRNERELARKAFVLGIPTAIPYDIVKVGDYFGSVFELLNAKSFSELIHAYPENLMEYVKLYVELLKKIHATVVKPGEMPNMNLEAIKWINGLKNEFPSDQWEKLYSLVLDIPEDNHMLHGDYHTKNVMLQNDEVLLIDMDTLALGNPVYEFAFMYNAYIGYEETLPKEQVGTFLGLNYEQVHTIWNETLKLYFNTEDEKVLESYTQKASIISYVRILRRTLRVCPDTEEGKKTIANCREKLAYLLSRVDSLAF